MEEKDARDVLADNVAAHIKAMDTNAWQFALQAKVGPAFIGRIKDRDTNPRLDLLVKIAAFVKVPVWQPLKPQGDSTELSAGALELAEPYDQCQDEAEKAKALAIAHLILTEQKQGGRSARARTAAQTEKP